MTPIGSPGRIEMLNGVPIYFEVHGSGESLLLLHGFSGCSQDWSAFVEEQKHATQEKFQLIIPDVRGHGRSFAPQGVSLLARKAHSQEWLCYLSLLRGGMTKRWRTCLRCSTICGIETFKGIG
jgi:pimeloyl-ACP methyl ester carboxylesterase